MGSGWCLVEKIYLLAPYRELLEQGQTLVGHYRHAVEVIEGHLDQGVREALELERQGLVEVFIARGGTVTLLREGGIKSPVVEIPITVYDMIRAVREARAISSAIGVVAYAPYS